MTTPISAELPVVRAGRAEHVGPVDGVGRVEVDDVGLARSFEGFYAEHRDSIARAVALVVGDADLAADSTDEAMIRAYQRWFKVGTLDRPAGWVYRVAINHGRSRLRRVARKVRYAALVGDDRSAAAAADEVREPRLQQALAALPVDQRAVVVLRVLLQFSEAECAEALGVRPGTVKSRLHRGLGRLRAAVPHLAPDHSSDGVTLIAPTDTTARNER